MPTVNMRNFATVAAFAASANALVPRDTSCCFHLSASGETSGQVGQLGDGQNRIGGNTPQGQFCIDSDGSITDGSGRGCILTPPTTQFQCDLGGNPTPGFSVNTNGQLEYNGQTNFVACETGQNGGLNIYTSPNSEDVTGCVSVQLNADSCAGSGAGSGSGSSSAPVQPSSSAPAPSSSVPAISPSPSVPGGGGQGPGSSSVPIASPSSVPGGGGQGPGEGTTTVPGSTATVPIVSSPSGPGGGVGPSGAPGTCEGCPATATVFTTVTVGCQPGVPGGGGETPTGPVGGGETPTGPGGGGQIPTGPAGGGQTPTGPAGGGETPTGPAGGGQTPTGPAGGGETPTGPAGGGQTPTGPAGGGETPTGPAGGGQTPTGPAGGGGTPSQTPSGTQPSGSCPTDLSGNYEYPHLIVPIDSSSPDQAAGTSFNGTVSSSVSTIFNFDIPESDAGKTCSLVFLFPKKEDLETSSYSFSGDGKVQFGAVTSPANQQTTYNNAPAIGQNYGDFTISPGNSYVISTTECPAGQTVGFEMSNAGSTELDFFEDYNPSPLGLYITVC